MAISTTDSITDMVTEGLSSAGLDAPSDSETTQATDKWYIQILIEIADLKKWKVLENTKVIVPDDYVHKYPVPSDYESYQQITLLRGDHTGIAQAGSSSSITLAAAENITEGTILGKYLIVTDGTNKEDMVQVTTYNESTKVATVSPDFTAAADNTTEYMIATIDLTLAPIPIELIREATYTGQPIKAAVYERELYLQPIPDDIQYALVMRYTIDITLVDPDVNTTREPRIRREWRNAIIAGIAWRTAKYLNDDREQVFRGEFDIEMRKLMKKDAKKKLQRTNMAVKSLGGFPKRR